MDTEMKVRVTMPWRGIGIGRKLIVHVEPTAPYYDGPAYRIKGQNMSIPVNHCELI